MTNMTWFSKYDFRSIKCGVGKFLLILFNKPSCYTLSIVASISKNDAEQLVFSSKIIIFDFVNYSGHLLYCEEKIFSDKHNRIF